jgi:hypothetical protein
LPVIALTGVLPSFWIDIETTVSAYCEKSGLRKPAGLDALVRFHIEAIEEWLTAP